VYEVRVSATNEEGERFAVTEWVNPESGQWRVGNSETFDVFSGDTYVDADEDGTYVRTGSKAYLGYLVDAVSPEALRHYLSGTADAAGVRVTKGADGTILRFDYKGFDVEASVVSSISAQRAAERGLFHVPETGVTTRARELSVGEPPTLPIKAYWFGPAVKGREAETATEYWRAGSGRDAATLYSVLYELPSAKGLNSSMPGQVPPEGEIQVVNQPASLELSKARVQVFNGVNGDLTYEPWPRLEVRLHNGEPAVAVPNRSEGRHEETNEFTVITDETLVAVKGYFKLDEIAELAAQLRPLRP
jgi:hypothetical protein